MYDIRSCDAELFICFYHKHFVLAGRRSTKKNWRRERRRA